LAICSLEYESQFYCYFAEFHLQAEHLLSTAVASDRCLDLIAVEVAEIVVVAAAEIVEIAVAAAAGIAEIVAAGAVVAAAEIVVVVEIAAEIVAAVAATDFLKLLLLNLLLL
jgi:hypothetical protein